MRQLLGRLTSPVPSRDDKSGDPGGRSAGSGGGPAGDSGDSPGDSGDKPGDPGDRPGDSGDMAGDSDGGPVGDSGDRPGSSGRARPGRGRSSRKIQAALAGEASAAVADVEYPPPAQDPAAAAFFDVDNTLMRGASIYHFARGLAARKMFRPLDLVRLAWGQLSFRLRGTENSDHIDAVRQSALAFVAGHQVADIVALGEEIYDDTMADRIWAGSRELTRRHLAAGQRVWLVTATPVELANILARRLGLTGALGTVAESVQGVYTGRLVGGLLHGEAKAAAIRALAVREGLDLARCTAYSDSANDLPMLSLVGYPHVVNPDADLLAEARRNGWPVHDFRSGRRVTMIALPAAAGAGAIAGGLAAGVALHRRRARS